VADSNLLNFLTLWSRRHRSASFRCRMLLLSRHAFNCITCWVWAI